MTERHPPKVHIPVSPEDSRTEIPRNPSWPIMLQTRLAYFTGTVCVMVQLLKRLGGGEQRPAAYLFVIAVGVGNDSWQLAVGQ